MSELVWTPIKIRLGQIIPWQENPRMSTKAQAQRLIKSERELGQIQTLAVSPFTDDGRVFLYDGHQRCAAWNTVKDPSYEVTALQSNRMLTDDERKKVSVLLHTATGSWDWNALSSWSAADLREWGMDNDTLNGWNTDANNLKEMLNAEQEEPVDAEPQTDRAAELQVKWQTETGQLWKLGEHRLLIGDCTVQENVERLMGGESADLVLTDPPYAVDYGAKNRALQSIAPSNRLEDDIAGDNLSVEETAEKLWSPAFQNAYNASRNGTVIYCFTPQGGDQMMMMMMMMKAKWNKRLHQLIWRKNSPTFSMGRLDYQYQHEPVLYSWRGTNHAYYGEAGRSVIDCDRPSSSKLHPTMKPVELFEIFIRNSSKEGEIVLEPFAGSGTTIIAAHNLNRRCYAMEISEKYGAVILERFFSATGITPELVE